MIYLVTASTSNSGPTQNILLLQKESVSVNAENIKNHTPQRGPSIL